MDSAAPLDPFESAPRSADGYRALEVSTPGGDVAMRLYRAEIATAGLVLVGGAGGGFDSPGHDLYGRLALSVAERGVSALRVRFRDPTSLTEAVEDVLAGIQLLEEHGISRVSLVGHSFGGAVVILAGLSSAAVTSVVCLATQGYGTDAVDRLARPLLLVHGAEDHVLPPSVSEGVFRFALEPKVLQVLEGAGHDLSEVDDQVFRIVRAFLERWLPARAPEDGITA